MNKDLVKIKEKYGLDLSPGPMLQNETLHLMHRFKPNSLLDGVRSVNVSSDNRYLIITFESIYGFIRVFDLEKLEILPHKYRGHHESVRLTSISGDSKFFFSSSWDRTTRQFELLTGKCNKIFSGFGRSPSCFFDTIGNKYLFTADYTSDIDPKAKNSGKCWDIAQGKPIYFYRHENFKKDKHPEAIDIAFDQLYVYTGNDDATGCKWLLEGGDPVITYFKFDGTVRKIAVSDKYFAAACTDGIVRVHWKISGQYFRYFTHGIAEVRDVRISKDEARLYSSSVDGTIACFSLISGEKLYHKKLHKESIWSICLMNGDNTLVTGSCDGSSIFLSTDYGKILARLYCYPFENEFLITCPPDKVFPQGFFYTSNTNFLKVYDKNREDGSPEFLDLQDPRRLSYINKLNLKNLVTTRIKSTRNYNLITESYLKNQKFLANLNEIKIPPALRDNSQ